MTDSVCVCAVLDDLFDQHFLTKVSVNRHCTGLNGNNLQKEKKHHLQVTTWLLGSCSHAPLK